MTPTVDLFARTLAEARQSFADYAAEYAALPLYRTICAGAAADDEIAGLLLAARPGQARPILFLAALHDLVLREPDLPAGRWYPSVVGRNAVPPGDPWPDIGRTIHDHLDELRHVIATHNTQTNEVGRAAYLAVGLALAAADLAAADLATGDLAAGDLAEQPVTLVEQGASAGLLLGVDRYRVELVSPERTRVLGDAASPVRCRATDRSTPPIGPLVLPRVTGRIGMDLHPVAHDDTDAIRWLEACLWPDVPGRVERFRAALAVLEPAPPQVRPADMIDDLAATIDAAGHPESHLVVYSSWALTYVDAERRPAIATVLRDAARDRPVTWLTAEATGCVPGLPVPPELAGRSSETVLGARRWRGGAETTPVVWGTCHPHGEWIDLTPLW